MAATSITALELIRRSLYLINALAAGEQPDSNTANDCLQTLNEMVDGWSTQTLAVFGSATEEYILVPNQGTYTYGVGGNFNGPRPIYVNDAYVTRLGVSTPLDIRSQEEFDGITLKAQTNQLPERLCYINTYPLGTVMIWPIPSEAITVGLNSLRVLTTPLTLATALALPPGYLKAMRYNLAVDLWPEYSNPLTDIARIEKTAKNSKMDIKTANSVEVITSLSDIPGTDISRNHDWRTG